MARPILDDIELQQVQKIEIDGDQALVRHDVPALEGDFFQGLGRRAMRITLNGVLTGHEVGEGLANLREKFRAAEPIPFVADITTATQVNQVIIKDMTVRDLAGKPERFEYAFTLMEFIPPPAVTAEPPPEIERPENPARNIDQGVGTLIVEVIVEGQPAYDFSRVTVNVTGSQQDGTQLTRTLINRTENIWTETDFPAGSYTVEASANASPTITGTAPAEVQAGQTTNLNVTLRSNAMVATTFIVHFRFDKAFIEPCMRHVLEQVAAYSDSHPDEKLVIVGHTDKVGPDVYNQSLSERRSRSSYSYLTFGGDRSAALAEWNVLRLRRAPGVSTAVEDSWEAHQYQFMLQELRYYVGNVDGSHGPLTDDAVQAYRCHKGFPPGTDVDDLVWEALIEDYLNLRTALNIPDNRLLPNTGPNCDGGRLKWLGCGEKDPVENTRLPRRQNRRTEFIFIRANQLNCEIPRPDTLDQPPLLPPGTRRTWCLDQGNASARCCFVTPAKQKSCPADTQQRWCRRPVDPATITLQGRIRFQGFPANARVRFKYIITAPNGEYIDGEVTSGSRKGEGQGKIASGRTDANGNFNETFNYSGKPKGFYTLEVTGPYSTDIRGPFLLRLDEQSYEDAKGNRVCKNIQSDSDRLNVTVLSVPALREIVLPVAVHLMTALHPTTREVRICPDPLNPAIHHRQQTTRTAADVRDLFSAANRIWRQARIRFDVVNIVNVTYSDNAHPQCAVGTQEFANILAECAYPNVTNVFFLGVLEAAGEAGVHVEVQQLGTGGTVLRTFEGIAIGDRVLLQLFLNAPPIPTVPDRDYSIIILSHELGHQLDLEHPNGGPQDQRRLMLSTLAVGNERLIVDEVQQARTSPNAGQGCMPLSLRVSGAQRIGGSRSHQYLVLQNPTGTVTIDAIISPHLIDPTVGSVTMTGGNPGATSLQRTVSTTNTGMHEIVATYTPVGGGRVLRTRVVIRVVTFTLRVEGATQIGATTEYVAARDPTALITVIAEISPAMFCVPNDLIRWSGGAQVDDPLRRSVSRNNVARIPISAELNSVTRSVTITIFQIDIVTTSSNTAAAATFTRIGLWDNAFDPATGNLRNAEAEHANFIGSDSRHFFLRVQHPGLVGEVRANWRTLFADNNNDDIPPSQEISLLEANSGVFISRAVQLVTDLVDRNQATHSGLPAAHAESGLRNRGQSNHRIRMTTVNNTHQLDGRVIAEYTPNGAAAGGPGATASVNLPIFNRAPEERRRIRVHLINVRRSVGGAGILTNARRDLVIETFQSIYAVCGIYAEIDVTEIDPPASCTGWTIAYPGDPIATDPSVEGHSFSAGISTPSASETEIMNIVRSSAGYNANEIYIICVARIYRNPVPAPPAALNSCCGGHAFPDRYTIAGSPDRGFAFVGVRSGITEYADVHEATHITTDFGHFDLEPAGAGAPGNIDGKNLMHRFFLRNTLGVSNPKRLWNRQFTNTHTGLVIPEQIDSIRDSRFVSNY